MSYEQTEIIAKALYNIAGAISLGSVLVSIAIVLVAVIKRKAK